MTFDFANTVDDFKETQNAHARAPYARMGRFRLILLWAFFAAIAITIILANNRTIFPKTAQADAAIGAMAVLSIALFVLLVATKHRKKEPPLEQYVSAKPKKLTLPIPGMFVWILFVGLACVLLMLLNHSPSDTTPASASSAAASPPANPVMDIFVPLILWLLIFGFIWFFVFRRLRGTVTKTWQRNPSYELRKYLDADDQRIIIDDSQTRTEMKWRAIKRFIETPNLFLLYTSDATLWMIPKRATTSAGVDEFRELLRAQIRAPIQAFPIQPMPVLPAESPLPPPPLPTDSSLPR